MPPKPDDRPIVVVKVGGSLLDWTPLIARLEKFLKQSVRDARVVLIVGGGPIADAVRMLDEARGLGAVPAHHLALGAMDLTAEMLAGELAGGRLVRELSELPAAWRAGLRPILATRRYLEEVDETADDPLPRSWRTTSDSISARIAERLGAARLILLKSCVPAVSSRHEAAEAGLVDPVFPSASAALECVEIVAFRQPEWDVRRLGA